MNFKITTLLFISLILLGLHASPQAKLSTKEAIEKLKKDVPDLMQKGDIPGMSIALIRDGKLVWTGSWCDECRHPQTCYPTKRF
jgi:CubicO group peptidase (beta-lactamase class C family)